MTRYAMDDDKLVDTDNATATWQEITRWNGSNFISVVTGDQWEHQTLYRSRNNRYYLEHTSQRENIAATAVWISYEDAARWLLLNDHTLPADLAGLAEKVME